MLRSALPRLGDRPATSAVASPRPRACGNVATLSRYPTPSSVIRAASDTRSPSSSRTPNHRFPALAKDASSSVLSWPETSGWTSNNSKDDSTRDQTPGRPGALSMAASDTEIEGSSTSSMTVSHVRGARAWRARPGDPSSPRDGTRPRGTCRCRRPDRAGSNASATVSQRQVGRRHIDARVVDVPDRGEPFVGDDDAPPCVGSIRRPTRSSSARQNRWTWSGTGMPAECSGGRALPSDQPCAVP